MAVLEDGFATIFSFAANPTVKFYEKIITPPGMDGGGPIDVTTMRNTLYRTFAPKKLKTLTPMTAQCSFDDQVFSATEVWAMIGVNQLITITFPDAHTFAFWGFLDKFIPGDLGIAEDQPMATVTIQPTMRNASGVETAGVWA